MILGVAPLYPMIIPQKGVAWIVFRGTGKLDSRGSFADIVHILLPSTLHHVRNWASKTLIKSFLSSKMTQVVVYFLKYHTSEAWRQHSLNICHLSSRVFIFSTQETIFNEAFTKPLRTVLW